MRRAIPSVATMVAAVTPAGAMAAKPSQDKAMDFEIEILNDPRLPGLYRWDIYDCEGRISDTYIGKYTRSSRPLKWYGRMVAKLSKGLPFKKNRPNGYRKIHHALLAATVEGRKVKLTLLENPPADAINEREAELIRLYGTLNVCFSRGRS